MSLSVRLQECLRQCLEGRKCSVPMFVVGYTWIDDLIDVGIDG